MDASVYLIGLGMGFSLIVAIGPQNAFVLRQGLRGEHVLAVVLACAFSDAVLIVLGVTSLARVSALLPWLDPVLRYGGALFLGWYGLRSLLSAFRSGASLAPAAGAEPISLRRTLLTCLAFTWLNPHVYLDTVVFLGTISTQYPGRAPAFALGATTASFLFFLALGYGATRLRPLFANPFAWRLLEAAIAVLMWTIALRLALGG